MLVTKGPKTQKYHGGESSKFSSYFTTRLSIGIQMDFSFVDDNQMLSESLNFVTKFDCFLIVLKDSKSLKRFMLSSILQKNERKQFVKSIFFVHFLGELRRQ